MTNTDSKSELNLALTCFGIAELIAIGIGAYAGGAIGAAVGAIILPAMALGFHKLPPPLD